jgi:hypothetical protein
VEQVVIPRSPTDAVARICELADLMERMNAHAVAGWHVAPGQRDKTFNEDLHRMAHRMRVRLDQLEELLDASGRPERVA